VAVDDIHGVSLQPSPHCDNSAQILPCNRQRRYLQTSLHRCLVYPRFSRRDDRDFVAARRHSARLVENPDFLPAPSA
jgi:hypothetical protein